MASNGKEKSNDQVDISQCSHCNSRTDDTVINATKLRAGQTNGDCHTACQDGVTKCANSQGENGVSKDVISDEMVRQRAFRWCRESIGGVWSKVQSGEELTVSHVSGGMSNYLYLISLPPALAKNSSEPTEVLLRIYGEISKSTLDFLIHNSVVFALLAEKRLGPKPFGMYHDGRIEEFIKADPVPTENLQKPEVMSLVAEKLAKFHCLKMPLSKRPTWFKTLIRGWLKDVMSNYSACSNILSALKEIAPPNFDLHSEFEELLTIASDLEAPVVFCHNDLQGGNLLLAPDGSPLKDKMTIIDWEYAHYNYRGFDFGNHFNEWTLDYSSPGLPGFKCIPEFYPSKEQQYMIFRVYLGELEDSDVSEESLYRLFKEANTLALHSHFLWGVWSIVQALTSSIEFDYSAYSLVRFQGYFRQKERLPALLERKS